MQLETIPLVSSNNTLDAPDFAVFSSPYQELVCSEIPTAKSVRFLSRQAFCETASVHGVVEKKCCYDRVQERNIPETIGDRSLLFPIPLRGGETLAALVDGIDPAVVKGMSNDWLRERVSYFIEQFLAIKKKKLDPLTHLYSGEVLSDILGAVDEQWKCQVIIIEVRPQARFPKDVLNHVKKVTRALEEFNRSGFPLFYLGHFFFGCITFNKERDFLKKFCLSVITFMKNKGFRRIHCGCSGIDKGGTDKTARAGSVVLGQAWTALHAACRRGPFGFCDYESLAHPEYFPLNHESRSVRSKLQRRWKNSHCHSLVYFVPDYKQVKEVADLVVRFFGNHEYVVAEKGFFVIRCDSTAEDSRQWAEELISRITSEQGNGLSLSAGISGYPFQDYTKTEIIRNCQKAILHAEFFGYGSVAVFDALSLNISGDVYYGEGDLAGAVREYRQGLKIDAANINLLNSLGVTYALMNRAIEARQIFQKVLELEPSNFMALYNRGLGEQANLDYATAASCFLAAFEAFDPDDSDEPGLLTDLFYQLGTVYFCNGEYEKALEWLEKWYEQQDDSRGRGKCCCPIGISYYKLGQTNKAMTWLQRALAFAEDDAEALSILGSLYLAEKEGNDIALKLMEKSLELESGNRQFMLRYARGLNECGRYTEAAAVLSECLASRKFKAAAWLELSVSFKGLKKYNKMRYYLNKILGNGSVLPEIKKKAKALYSEMIAETG